MSRFLLSLLFIIGLCGSALAGTDKILNVQKLTTPRHIEAWLVEDKTVPVISINFSFEGGLAYDPEDKEGVGRLVSILLDEGADQMDSQEFQSKLSNNAISMRFTAGRDAFYGQMKTLKSKKGTAFDLLRLALTRPRFDVDAMNRMKNTNISKIKDDMGDPGWLVARSFNGMVFEGHNYARPGFGTLASMTQITRKDLVDFTHAQFAQDVLKVSIAGDISKEEAQDAVDFIFGDLPEKAEPVEGKKAALAYGGKTILLSLDTPQTYISVGEEGISRDDKDWHAASVMNYILGGGGFDSRLMHEIREKRGLTYGVYSTISSMKDASLLQVNMSASNDKVEESLKILKEEWEKMAAQGATEQELQNAKSYLTGSLLLELTSTNDISEILNSLQREKLDFNYINNHNTLINAVTLEDIKRVAARLLKTKSLTTVLVGKPKNITVDILLDSPPGMKEERKK
jgi:zinc protease